MLVVSLFASVASSLDWQSAYMFFRELNCSSKVKNLALIDLFISLNASIRSGPSGFLLRPTAVTCFAAGPSASSLGSMSASGTCVCVSITATIWLRFPLSCVLDASQNRCNR